MWKGVFVSEDVVCEVQQQKADEAALSYCFVCTCALVLATQWGPKRKCNQQCEDILVVFRTLKGWLGVSDVKCTPDTLKSEWTIFLPYKMNCELVKKHWPAQEMLLSRGHRMFQVSQHRWNPVSFISTKDANFIKVHNLTLPVAAATRWYRLMSRFNV